MPIANEATVANVLHFLSAYSWSDVKEAFKRLNRDMVRASAEQRAQALNRLRELGWSEHAGAVPSGFEWQKIGHRVFVRDPSIPVDDPSRVTVQGEVVTRRSSRRKTDTSVKPVSDLKCPQCGGEMFKEPICPGCEEGRRGLKIRLLCGECDYVLSL